MKRFVETTKWDDKWFRALPPEAKLFWDWICSKCDQAGVIDPDFDLSAFQIGMPITESILQYFDGRIERIPNGKLHIVKFVQFQYGKLSRQCKPHQPVFAAMERHGIDPDAVAQNDSFKESVDESVRQRIIARDGLFCAYYGKKIAEHEVVIDHIFPRSKGGKATDDNLVVASFRANSKKWDYSPEQFCEAAGLNKELVFERLSKATGKAINEFYDNSNTLLGRVKEKETDQEEEKEKESSRTNRKRYATHAEVVSYAKSQPFPISEECMDTFFDRMEEIGWTDDKGLALADWRARFRRYATNWSNNANRKPIPK